MHYKKPNLFFYRLAQLVSNIVARVIFKRKLLRNEIKHAKGPFLVIANHQAAYDFVNLIGTCKRRMTFVISNSFYQSLPVKGILDKLGVIPKQQFQTTVNDMKKIKAAIDAGEPVVIYPAGLMCEDGLSTPIPAATYKLFQWLGVDVYMAKVSGTYFAMPKWSKGFRSGRTTMDIYKLFSKEELRELSKEEIRERADQALLFDAYREQEQLMVKYKNGDCVEGLENVLYACPNCDTEFSITVEDQSTLRCTCCGYAHYADAYGFLHRKGKVGKKIRYVSDWSRHIFERMKKRLSADGDYTLSATTAIHTVDPKKKKFILAGKGRLTLNRNHLIIEGLLGDKPLCLKASTASFPSLPFSPGKYIEVQDGKAIYRCVLNDGRLAMKFINMIKAGYELRKQEAAQ